MAHVTSGEKHDRKQQKELISMAEGNGYKVDEIICEVASGSGLVGMGLSLRSLSTQ